MFENINKHVRRYTPVPDEDIAFFNSIIEVKKVPKKTFLLKEGEIDNFEAYVNKGCIRTFFIDDNGFEVTLNFAVEDWWIGDLASFNSGKPTKLYIETLEDCELLYITRKAVDELFIKCPVFERVFRIMVERSVVVLSERLFATILKPALERYQDFLERYPTIPQRVSQQYIASYLGISPEFLSKLRNKIAKGKV